jgi:hypothetical protein
MGLLTNLRGRGPMLPAISKIAGDPFEGLRLPVSVWKALEDARITSLEQLKAMTPVIDQVQGIGPEVAQVIRDRLERLSARRTVRVRLIFPKRSRQENKASNG